MNSLFIGKGLFETIRVEKGRCIFLKDHLLRLKKGADFFKWELPLQTLHESIVQGARKTAHPLAYFKLYVWQEDAHLKFKLVTGKYEPDTKPWRLGLTAFVKNSDHPLLQFKTTSYLDNLFILEEGKKKGFDELFFTNEKKEITEGTKTNIFWIKKKTLLTPQLACGCLPGIIREKVFKIAQKIGITLEETRAAAKELEKADSVFMTNSLVQIKAVNEFQEIRYDINHPTVILLKKELDKFKKDPKNY